MARTKVVHNASACQTLKRHDVEFLEPQSDLTDSSLSSLARSFWAKSGRGRLDLWLSVPQHLMDALDVAGKLFDEYASEHHRKLMASVWGGDQGSARSALCFLAAVHDVGKCSPAFACQVPTLADLLRPEDLEVPYWKELPGRSRLPHGFVSYFALVEAIVAGGGYEIRARQWAALVAVHHGKYPSPSTMNDARAAYSDTRLAGSDRWRAARREIIEWAAKRTGFPLSSPEPSALPRLPIAVASAYASLIVMADWIASNESFFPLLPIEQRLASTHPDAQIRRLEAGWRAARMPSPMRFGRNIENDIPNRYRLRFGWGDEIQTTAAQVGAVQIAEDDDPDLMIVEAPPGSGKTELAFSVVEVLMKKRNLQGVMVALPTQATTDAMFERAKAWLRSILEDVPQDLGVFLAHGKNELNEDFLQLLDNDARGLEVHDDDSRLAGSDREAQVGAGLVANSWMASRWRSLLSPVVVGTIDQVLLAALQSRHVLMRHLGLMGKVVIIDEVHAADAYMETYLESALTWLGMYEVPVVLLSATLPSARRRALVSAYQRGRTGKEVGTAALEGDIGYPVITSLPSDGRPPSVKVFDGGQEHVKKTIRPVCMASEGEIGRHLHDLLDEGGCALVVRNTVDEAQRTYDALLGFFDADETTLLHSRFLASDRIVLDGKMRDLFGKNSRQRPRRHVVVATQVIEQSLDIDFDVVLTDPAPMDLLLQRAGRLHRHIGRIRASRLHEAECLVLLKTIGPDPWEYSKGSERVYGAHRILRMLAMLSETGQLTVAEPEDYAMLTQRAYSDEPLGPESWQELMEEARREAESNENTARLRANEWSLYSPELQSWTGESLLIHFSGNEATGEEASPVGRVAARAAVRDSEDQIPIIVVPIDPFSGGVAVEPPWEGEDGDPRIIETSTWPSSGLARRIRSWSVSLPPWKFKEKAEDLDATIAAVAQAIWKDERVTKWRLLEHPLLSGELVLPMVKVDEFSDRLEAEVRGRRLVYTNRRGLEVQNS